MFSIRSIAPTGAPTLALALALLSLPGCNTGGGSGGDGNMVGTPGEVLAKPDGSGWFFNDANQGGEASSLRLVSMSWGRLVDVHDIDPATGMARIEPVYPDFVIDETIQSDGQSYTVDTNPVTQNVRLIIHATRGDGVFEALLESAVEGLAPVLPKSDQPGTLPPFSFVARNATLVLRFDDLLRDDAAGQLTLHEDVLVQTDYPPTLPLLDKRVIFDPNHGGLADDGYHATRVLIDLTVSEADAQGMIVAVGLNSLGLPPSNDLTTAANVAVRLPTRTDPSSGQFSVLTNLGGSPLSTSANGPTDPTSPTWDVVRAMRSGNSTDPNNGFLVDLAQPELVGGWLVTVDQSVDDPAGVAGIDFLVDFTFTTPCRSQPLPGHILEIPAGFFEVVVPGPQPGAGGQVTGVSVRSLGGNVGPASLMLGNGLFRRTYAPGVVPSSQSACWFSFIPQPGLQPGAEVAPNSQVVARFSEPMDPASVTAFDTLQVVRLEGTVTPIDLVVGVVQASGDAREFTFTPTLPFAHVSGSVERYYIRLDAGPGGVTDLAGNAPVDSPDDVHFDLEVAAPTEANGGVMLRFSSVDEISHPPAAIGVPDFRGQFLFDASTGSIRPRPVQRTSYAADPSQPVVANMVNFAPGVQTPLSPLGSRLMGVWRYMDLGMSVTDESTNNLDVEGLSWSPVGGAVVADVYPEFEIRLAHSVRLPDEATGAVGGQSSKPNSGPNPGSFAQNVLASATGPQKIVHPKGKGYVVNPLDLYVNATGTFLMPWPMNRGESDPAKHVRYTWRDTAVLEEAGPDSCGIEPLFMETLGLIPDGTVGLLAPEDEVPSVGLPLLLEYRTYPTPQGVGLNSFNVSLALTTSRLPAFRVFSTGGVNTQSQLVTKDPDLELVPSGGFNPNGLPPGSSTPPDDNVFYKGQLDVITRISRVHTIWIDTQTSGADFVAPVVLPLPDEQPQGTQVVFAWRGASAITGLSQSLGLAYDADLIDPYGDVRQVTGVPPTADYFGTTSDIQFFPQPDPAWWDDLDDIDGAALLQARLTFVGDPTSLLSASLSGLGLAWAGS